jgi:hypothetical protein
MKPIKAQDILISLVGKWSIHREIKNNIDNSISGISSGIVEFRKISNKIVIYEELVETCLNNGLKLSGKISYIFKIEKDKLQQYGLTKQNNEVKEDHMFELNFFDNYQNKSASASYLCKNDRYEVVYCFYGKNLLSIDYKVKGDKKNYFTHTQLEKESINKPTIYDMGAGLK